MLCGTPASGEAIDLAKCLVGHWEFGYEAYRVVYYVLGGAGVLVPILSTILSDVESKSVRRIVTGFSAATVGLFAFLDPQQKMAMYRAAHTELRNYVIEFEQAQKAHANQPAVLALDAEALLKKIEKIDKQLLRDEDSAEGKNEANKPASLAKEPPREPTVR